MNPSTLTDADVERVAQRVVDLLRQREREEPQLLTVRELAKRFSVSTDLIYEHSAELGAVRLGSRLLFDPDLAAERLRELHEPASPTPARSGKRKSTRTDLLEIPEEYEVG